MTSTFRRAAAIAAVGLAAFIACALPSVSGHLPVPATHDEFAYLLQADTFAHGRLANQPHEHWQFFETMHVLQQPKYAAKFPPGQGIALAVGQILWRPILGAWLSVAIGCAAVAWMLMGMMPWRWAALGGILVACAPAVQWWGQTYWGGGVAMIGGALLCGAATRIARHSSAHSRDATRRASSSDARRVASRLLQLGLVAGVGLAILANSRPFEGLILAFLLAGLVLFHALRGGTVLVLLKYVTPGIAAIMIPVAGWMAYYNWRVTGDPFLMPYQLHARQYMVAPLMFWQHQRPMPHYRHDVLRQFYADFEWQEYARYTAAGRWQAVGQALSVYVLKPYMRPWIVALPIALGFLALPWSRAARWAAITLLGLVVIHFVCTPWMRSQYLAPVVGSMYALMAAGLRGLSLVRWRQRRVGLVLAATIIVLQVSLAVVAMVRRGAPTVAPTGVARAGLIQRLRAMPGDDWLVFVRHGPSHSVRAELVFNDADIDSADIIFARDMGAANLELMGYYPQRRVLLVDLETESLTLMRDRPVKPVR